jgi:hypothetical protein
LFLHFDNFFSPYPSWFLPTGFILCLPVPAYFASKADLTSRIHSSVLFILSPSITILSRPLFSLYLSLSLFTLPFCSLRLQCKVQGTFLFVRPEVVSDILFMGRRLFLMRLVRPRDRTLQPKVGRNIPVAEPACAAGANSNAGTSSRQGGGPHCGACQRLKASCLSTSGGHKRQALFEMDILGASFGVGSRKGRYVGRCGPPWLSTAWLFSLRPLGHTV